MYKYSNINLGKKIKEIRENKNISLEEVAKLSGLHRTTLSIIEKGEMSITLYSIAMIANALNVKLSELFKNLENE